MIDITPFKQIFFEESCDGLDLIESTLLDTSPETIPVEAINIIFRAAHSIKGGSSTFGFECMTSLTHTLETLLDQFRSGQKCLSTESIQLILETVDCLRGILITLQQGDIPCLDSAISLEMRIQDVIHADEYTLAKKEKWLVDFIPNDSIFLSGNEPLRILRQAKRLGHYKIDCNIQNLPKFDKLDTEKCYLNWHLELEGKIAKKDIENVFEWILEDCKLSIENSTALASSKTASQLAPEQRTTIRVDIHKIDHLLNMVGELVINQSALNQFGKSFDISMFAKLRESLQSLNTQMRELQESVMQIRMVPLSNIFNRLPRVVHDLAQSLEKKVEITIKGAQAELDKTVLEKLSDPINHLIRNCIDHGIEFPEKRRLAGKPERGLLTIDAFHQGSSMIIEVSDDGAGIPREKIMQKARALDLIKTEDEPSDSELYQMLFLPGFSTAEKVSDISGRGVGLDVVLQNIQSVGGSIQIISNEGNGTKFILQIPLTLAIIDGQLLRVGGQVYVLPLATMVQSIQIEQNQLRRLSSNIEVLMLRDEAIPVIRLRDIFKLDQQGYGQESLLVIVESAGEKVGLLVDELQAQQQIVIKSLETNYQKIDGISGATILGDGKVALILDVHGIVKLAMNHRNKVSL